ncbi:MAG: hypothetical protein U0U66_09695 [Cytophagaceae bacterium]
MKFLLPIAYFLKIVFTPTNTHWENDVRIKKVKSSIKKTAQIDARINESSGLVYDSIRKTFYTINDSGGDPVVFEIDTNGTYVNEYRIPGATNKDWEEIQWDATSTTFWIGDIGNNRNQRKNLRFYSYNMSDSLVNKYAYRYTDQTEFPPVRLNYDAEAFVKIDSTVLMFSKNRTTDPSKVYQYSIGDSVANVITEFPMRGMVTGASIVQEDSTSYRLAVLTYGWIYFYRITIANNAFVTKPIGYRKFLRGGQNEGIAWVNSQTIYISNEKGKLFRLALKRKSH